jgi:hypothetical protein
LDVAEPPRIVLASRASCDNDERAEQLLRDTLAPARAPGRAWVVTMRVERSAARALRAEGEITDGSGAPVAHRVLSVAGADCEGLARAVGVWASLVLDAEVARSAQATPPGPAPSPDSQASAAAATVPWPAPAVAEKPSPEHAWYLQHDVARTLEIGVGAFLMGGTAASAVAGATPYVVVEAGRGVFLRPSLLVGESLPSLAQPPTLNAVWAATRFDTCLRVPGLYNENRGIQIDLCGGAELGFTSFGTPATGAPNAGIPASAITLPHVAAGPSLDLRGELGGRMSVALRGVAGIDLLNEGFDDATGAHVEPSPWSARLELAFSWRLR